jgi:hypothetical protein
MANSFQMDPGPRQTAMDEWRLHQAQRLARENTKPLNCEGCGAPVAIGRSCKYCGGSNDRSDRKDGLRDPHWPFGADDQWVSALKSTSTEGEG